MRMRCGSYELYTMKRIEQDELLAALTMQADHRVQSEFGIVGWREIRPITMAVH